MSEGIMSQESIATLRAQLDIQHKKLNLIHAIDYIRDTVAEPSKMLTSIVNTLTDHLQADLCVLILIDQETGQPEMKTVNDRSHKLGQIGRVITRDLAERAVNLERAVIWEAKEVLKLTHLDQFAASLQLAAVPIIMNEDKRLGALLIARSYPTFSESDLELLSTAESQIDSAVIQGYAHNELQQRIRELETIYRIDHIRDQSETVDEMLNAVLEEVCSVIKAEIGFTMLYNQSGHRLELRAATHYDLFEVSPYYESINRLSNESLEQAKLLYKNNLHNGLRSVMCMPLILNDQIIGVLGVVNRHAPTGFSSDDRRLLQAIASQLDTAIFESIERRRLQQVLGRSVDPRIMQRLLANPDVDFLKGERSTLTVLYADLRGSTLLAERTDPELLVGFINHYLGQMTEVILAHEGTLDKFVGDEVMALFGAPFPQADHALRAVRVGLAMQAAHQAVVEMWRDRGVPAPPIGIGVATGELIVGEMGCPQRADYTVIGRAANLGARICNVAQGGQLLISEETYDLVKDSIEATPLTGFQFKGVNREVVVYDVQRVME